MSKTRKHIINGLSERHIAQIIRRNMLQKTEPNSKTYKRKKYRYNEDEE
jgi:hypothetical protein